MLLLNADVPTSANIAPTEILKRLGLPPAGGLPQGVAVGPFLWKGLLDFDAAAASTVSDLLAYDNFDWHAFIPRLNKATENKPEVILAISGIEIIFIDQAMLEHADPEDVFKVFEGIYLEATQKGSTRTWALRDGCHVAAKPAGLIDSDQATEVRAYQYPTKGLQLFPEGTLLFDMSDLSSSAFLAIRISTCATSPARPSLPFGFRHV